MNTDYIKIDEYKQKLKKTLKPERYEHTLRTVQKAMELCVGTAADRDRVFVAALLHDCAKYITPNEKQRAKLIDYLTFDKVIHAPLGALVARDEYGITDETVLNAIKNHTTGRANMSVEEKIVLLADSIEDGRDYDGVDYIRRQTEISIDDGIIANLEGIAASFKENTHHLTLEALDFLRRQK